MPVSVVSWPTTTPRLELAEIVTARRCELLLGFCLAPLAPPLQITPDTRDQDVAAVWLRDYTSADVGIEGVVIKGLGQPYRSDARTWLKLRSRTTAEARPAECTCQRLLRPGWVGKALLPRTRGKEKGQAGAGTPSSTTTGNTRSVLPSYGWPSPAIFR